jgi:hypothetical protein
MAWFKVFMPLLVELLKELFKAGGDGRLTTGMKVSVLLNMALTAVLVFVTMTYIDLYRVALECRVHATGRETQISNKQAEIATLGIKLRETRLKVDQLIIAKPPPVSYKQGECVSKTQPVYIQPKAKVVKGDNRRRIALMEAVNN